MTSVGNTVLVKGDQDNTKSNFQEDNNEIICSIESIPTFVAENRNEFFSSAVHIDKHRKTH